MESQELLHRVENYLLQNPKASNEDIANSLKVTLSSVTTSRVKINRPGKRTRVQMKELEAQFIQYYEQYPKAKVDEAAGELRISRRMVVYLRRKLDLASPRTPEIREGLKERIRQCLSQKPDLSNRELTRIVGGVSKTTVVAIRKELGAKRDQVSGSLLFISIAQQVRDLVVGQGASMTDHELADKIGISRTTVRRWLRKLGLPNGKERRCLDDEKYFRKMWADGWSDTAIAAVMGCCHQRVQKWRYRSHLVANVIHHSVRKNASCRFHTPTTLLDVVGSPTGSKKLDRVWAFAALGADVTWLKRRFPGLSAEDLSNVVRTVLQWEVPKNLSKVIRRKQLSEKKS